MPPSLRQLFAALLLVCPLWAQAQPMRYVYPPPESGSDVRLNYYWELLQAALDETAGKWGPYALQASPKVMNAGRAELLLAASSDISVMARTTSIARENALHPIRIPLDKGLTGYRLFLIKADTQAWTDPVRTLEQLQQLSIGQGATWVDTDILRANGFTVVTAPSYDLLLPMLNSNRFDLFSRGVNEISQELASGSRTYPALAIERKLLLYYPLPRYFFFPRTAEGERLAQRAEEGLRLLMKNGKFEKKYQIFKKSILSGLQLSGRRVFKITNPLLPAQTPLADRDLWDSLETELRAKP
ncbi:hypothetical protein [Rhodoferax sp.]|uniref:hypothetical protein n=1 Tax=Rhodoferax sp. TaxID=50421 RepID=UPI002ACE03EE|nr:hypothetical protein [Rhodoferax sp.]